MAGEIVETRQLGEQERLFHQLHRAGALVASGVSHIRGPLSPELVRRAYAWLQRQHPILNAHIRYEGWGFVSIPPFIYPMPWFDTRGTTEMPIRVVTDPDPEAWRAILAVEKKRPIGKGKHPRQRITIVRTHEGADIHHLVSTIDHAIADAQAGSMLNTQLFAYLDNPEEMEKLPPVQVGLPPALETGLPRSSGKSKKYVPAIRFPITKVPNPVKESRSLQRHIGPQVTAALYGALKGRRATMHGGVGAAFLAAAREKFGIDEMTVLSTVELRRMMKPPLPVTAFGCYIDILRTRHELSNDFWAMASDLSFKLIAAIARDRQAASILRTFTWEMLGKEIGPTLTHRGRIDGIAITTAGATNFRPDTGKFKVEGGGEGGIALEVFGPSLFIGTFEQHGTIDLFVAYSATALSDDDANDLADRAVAALTAAAEPARMASEARQPKSA